MNLPNQLLEPLVEIHFFVQPAVLCPREPRKVLLELAKRHRRPLREHCDRRGQEEVQTRSHYTHTKLCQSQRKNMKEGGGERTDGELGKVLEERFAGTGECPSGG